MNPYWLCRGEGEQIWMFDALDTIKASTDHTDGSFTLFEFFDFQGSAVPLHLNDRWDRGFYVLQGEYIFVVGDENISASPGAWVFVPRNTLHAWRCESAEGRLLNVTVPGGFERFYREVGEGVIDPTHLPPRREPEIESLSNVAAQHGITITGPPPSE